MATRWKEDSRPKSGWWAPGDYANTCVVCLQEFMGDKLARWCADCAYKTEDERVAIRGRGMTWVTWLFLIPFAAALVLFAVRFVQLWCDPESR